MQRSHHALLEAVNGEEDKGQRSGATTGKQSTPRIQLWPMMLRSG